MANDHSEAPECLECIWPFIKFYRILGLFPVSRSGNAVTTTAWLNWFPTIFGLLIQLSLIAYYVRSRLKFTDKDGTTLMVWNIGVYYIETCGNYLFVIRKIWLVPNFLKACASIEAMCKKYDETEERLVRSCIRLFYFFTFMQILGIGLYFLSNASMSNAKSLGFFEGINSNVLGHSESYSYFTGVLYLILGTWCDVTWSFADIFLAQLSVIFASYFTRFNRELGRQRTMISVTTIERLYREHQEICNLVTYANEIFRPLFLLTYTCNIMFLLPRLYVGFEDLYNTLTPVWLESVYAVFYHCFVKILLPSFLSARLNEKAKEGLAIIQRWPGSLVESSDEFRLLVIGRFVARFRSTDPGISLSGFIILSKSFFVKLISIMITFEIIILQFDSAHYHTDPNHARLN